MIFAKVTENGPASFDDNGPIYPKANINGAPGLYVPSLTDERPQSPGTELRENPDRLILIITPALPLTLYVLLPVVATPVKGSIWVSGGKTMLVSRAVWASEGETIEELVHKLSELPHTLPEE